ncbi:MAG: hypothetical protein SAJ12_12450 [Jaaginema sp. PMC 1079.18]|nr:hypothetical protein [Jaaginema sp. PMC 1080.18]MEC4851817.1 hypothetical protein [Jaaginema sp. PMC 1079.18]MEC4865995.1 hypothetical protein [Jaaginema sp. PMC 1078.18]
MRLNIVNRDLLIEWEWYEMFWAFHFENPMKVPLMAITGVSTVKPSFDWRELRIPGTFVPGVIKAGTYYTFQGRDFWYGVGDRNYLTLILQNYDYNRIILTLEDNLLWRERLAEAIESSSRRGEN